jgi:hypothetical protein
MTYVFHRSRVSIRAIGISEHTPEEAVCSLAAIWFNGAVYYLDRNDTPNQQARG